MPDHERPLNERGIGAARDLGLWLASRGYLPDEVLCSDAQRTLETWQGIAPALRGCEVAFKPALYHAAPDVMMAVLRQAQGACVMMIGHNPGIAEFAHRLAAKAPISTEFVKYPTGATLVLDFEIGAWADIDWSRGSAIDFIVPREIMAA